MLEAKNLFHKFDYPILDDVSLSLKPKQSIAITGVSGSGKSTLLHIMSTLLPPDSGEILYREKPLYKLKEKSLLDVRRYHFGIIFQSHYLFRGFSAKENLELASILSKEEIDHNLLEKISIDSVMNQSVTSLSGGQQQRISIARVLTKKPKIIFADEPTGNLDKNTAKEVMDAIFSYIDKNNASLLLVTHDDNLARMCDEVYKLENAKLINIS